MIFWDRLMACHQSPKLDEKQMPSQIESLE
jgi:hypothetical protein